MHHQHLRSRSEGSSRQQPRSTWDPKSAPAMLDVYAKKPLPPLPKCATVPELPILSARTYTAPTAPSASATPVAPTTSADVEESSVAVPAPLNIKKKSPRRKQVAATKLSWMPPTATSGAGTSTKTISPSASTSSVDSDLSVNTRSTSPSSLRGSSSSSAGSPGRSSSRTNNSRRSSQKVMQLMGHDINIMSHTSPWDSDSESRASRDTYRSASRFFDSPTSDPSSCISRGIPEDAILPMLEADLDGISSKSSSWSQPSPLSLALNGSLQPNIRNSVGSSKFGECDSPGCCSLHDSENLLGRWDPAYNQFSDTKVAGEYHKFAVELAASIDRESTDTTAPGPKSKRASAFLSFSTNAQFSRRRNRPTSIDPSPGRGSSSDKGSPDYTTSAPTSAPASIPETSEPDADIPRSAFESDSDDEQKSKTRWLSRDRDSILMRRNDDGSRAKTWSKTGDQMKELLANAKDKARGLPVVPSKLEKRREVMRREITVLHEGVVA